MAGLSSPSTVIVTGAASGIGLATARALLVEGWHVIALDRDEAALLRFKGERAQDGERLAVAALDVTDETAAKEVVTRLTTGLPPLRGLVTSAGIGSNTSFFDTTPDLIRRLNEVNVIGSFTVARASADIMRREGGGAIVLIASVSGLIGNRGRTAYGASKGAIVNMTSVMAVELAAANIRVNAIAPGPIETDMARAVHSAEVRAEWRARVPLGRYGTPEEIAEAALFLLDVRRASYITGQVLAVDGGFTIAGLIQT